MADIRNAEQAEQPRALIVTLYGLYGRDTGWLAVGALVKLLSALGVEEPAVRSAISRLKRRGLLQSEHRQGVAGYVLSEDARGILEEGDGRIFGSTETTLDQGWLLAVFSVPETERAKRHKLRSQLATLGFGSAAPGVWVAPAHRYELTAATLERLRLSPYVDLFRADYLAFGDIGKLTAQWWDLAGLRDDYARFISAYQPVLDRVTTPQAAFRDWVNTLTAWRRLPYRDPGLPVELMPADWPGYPARRLFEALRAQLSGAAKEFVTVLLEAGRSVG